jgi:hypothetical protein
MLARATDSRALSAACWGMRHCERERGELSVVGNEQVVGHSRATGSRCLLQVASLLGLASACVEPRSGWTPNERKRTTLTLLPCPDMGRAGALRASPPFDKTTITAAGKESCVCVLVRPCKARCVWVWEEYKKEKRERAGETKKETKKTRGWEGGKKKKRERRRGGGRAPLLPRRVVVTCASDRRPRGGGGVVVVRKREAHDAR